MGNGRVSCHDQLADNIGPTDPHRLTRYGVLERRAGVEMVENGGVSHPERLGDPTGRDVRPKRQSGAQDRLFGPFAVYTLSHVR